MVVQAGQTKIDTLTESLAATGYGAAFTPTPGKNIMLTLSGTWTGTAELYRSIDGGTTKVPCSLGGTALSWSGAISEPVWVEPQSGVLLYVHFTKSSGTLVYTIGE